MDNGKILPDALSAEERTVLRAIRHWCRGSESSRARPTDGTTPEAVSVALRQFLSTLRDSDPFALNLRAADDMALTLFELQVIYVLSEHQAGHTGTTAELLDWWFPADLVATGDALLGDIADALERSGIALESGPWIRDYLLAFTARRAQANRPPAAPSGVTVH